MKINLKAHIGRLFLDRMVAPRVPLNEAIMMTLGGDGVESIVWAEKGIKFDRGWLVERGLVRSKNLIRSHRFRTHNQLRTFPQILAGYGPDKDHIDGGHIDLCGTLCERAIRDFSPVLPLIFKGRGRCLAITIADARRNLILENWKDFQKRGRKLFGEHAQEIYKKILALQERIPTRFPDLPDFIQKTSFTPEKGAKREFGLLVELAELLKTHRFKFLPSHIERYVYVSDYCGNAFRMRTYFFRFEKKKVLRPALALARAWTRSPLRYSRRGEFEDVRIPDVIPTNNPKTQETSRMQSRKNEGPKPSKLAVIMAAIGGEPEAEYKALLAKAEKVEKADKVMIALKQLGPLSELLRNVSDEAAVVSSSAVVPAAVSIRKTRAPRLTWESFSSQDQIKWLLDVLETRMKTSRKMWDPVWERFLRDQFGYYDKELGCKMRSILARACGKFRSGYERRIREAFNGDAGSYLDRLAKLPSKVPDKLA